MQISSVIYLLATTFKPNIKLAIHQYGIVAVSWAYAATIHSQSLAIIAIANYAIGYYHVQVIILYMC